MRGKPANGRFSLFYYRGNELLAVNCINQPLIFWRGSPLAERTHSAAPDEAATPASTSPGRYLGPPPLEFDIPWRTKFEKQQLALAWDSSNETLPAAIDQPRQHSRSLPHLVMGRLFSVAARTAFELAVNSLAAKYSVY